MRFRHPDGSTVHLAYCTNVHPAETLDGVLAQLRDHCEPVRRRLGRDRLGIGLWLAKDAARALVTDPVRPARRCAPNSTAAAWKSSPSTASRTRGSAPRRSSTASTGRTGPTPSGSTTPPTWPGCWPRLLPDDVTEGTISTLPLAWRTDFDAGPRRRHDAPATALTTLAERLDALEELTGRSIRIGLEPEPGCTVETTADAIAPLTGDRRHRTGIGICVDTCHLATSFEDPRTALDALRRRRRARRQVPALRRPARRTPRPARSPRGPRRLRRTPLPAPDPHPHRRRALRGTDDLGEAVAGRAPCPTPPLARPLPRPAARPARRRPSPPPCPSSRTR